MNRQIFRLVRLAAIVFPVMWFLYLLHVVAQGEINASFFPRDASEEEHFEDGPQTYQDLPHRAPAEVLDSPNFPEYAEKHKTDSRIAKFGHVDFDKAIKNMDKLPDGPFKEALKGGLENKKAMNELNEIGDKMPGVEQFHRDEGNNDVNSDSQGKVLRVPSDNNGAEKDTKGSDIDEFADVTYPPYVERLPAGADGNSHKGLKINKDRLSPEKKKEYQEKWDKNSFNQMASDLIPVHRELQDFRSEACRNREYPPVLPKISVVIIFHNEAWSVLLRSVHSILDRTRDDLLLEVILVDDLSTMEHLKKPLDKYFRDYPKVKIVRSPVRGGLTKARLRGFAQSKGDVIVFLDSHIECSPGWAEPLVVPIAEDYRAVVFPIIDMIGAGDLFYMAHQASNVGTFNLQSLTFTWSSANLYVLDHYNAPANTKPSPTMPGGLFAISRRWFEELGQYDPELDYWGGENMELSFKAWMCNGSILIAECSHIGHIFRSTNPIKWSTNLGHRNYVRVAKVWMDSYKNHYFERINYDLGDYGNVSSRLVLRQRLGCRDFGWYVDNIYPELKQQMVQHATYAGEVKHVDSKQCLDKMSNQDQGPQLFGCHSMGGPQFWYFTDDKYLQIENRYVVKGTSNSVQLSATTKDEWRYDEKTQQLEHVESGLCLQKAVDNARKLTLAKCMASSSNQRWSLQKRRPFQDT